MKFVLALLFCGSLLRSPLAAQAADSLDFLTGLSDFREIRSMLPAYLKRIAFAQLEERERKAARIRNAQDLAARRAYLREHMLRDLGGLPAGRTPLNAQTVAVLDRDGYRIEKVIFESQPRFYVTANLYLPKSGKPPYPAVLFPLGHEEGAKAHATWQYMLVSLAKKGYVALAWDPVGQGERVQLYDADFEDSKVFRSTTEHTIAGIQCLLVGDNLVRYTIWDGMRALDYLVSRPEVDQARVACTGNSGGGTHTAYLSALDDRIQVAAPSCYITSWRRLLLSIGPQDAEQCIPPWLHDGLDHADFIYAFAPKPYLVLSAIRDFFPILGGRETFQEVKRVYTALGAPEKCHMVEADDGHGYSKPRRLAAYNWFARWLKGTTDHEPEPEVVPETPATLNCTRSGQVAASLGGETVFTLNQKRLAAALNGRKALSKEQMQQEIRRLTGWGPQNTPLHASGYGTIQRSGYHIEKLTYESEPGILVPSLLFVPEGGPGRAPALIYVHDRGKAAAARDAEELVQSGLIVLAIDARGWGETRPKADPDTDFARYFGDYYSAMTALLAGKTLVGMRAEDISRGVDLLASQPAVDSERIYGFGRGAGAAALLHAAALDQRLQRVALEGMVLSYESVVNHKIHRGIFESVIPGVLRSYDLPDVVALLAPRPVSIVNAVDPLGHPAEANELRMQYARAAAAFQKAGAAARLRFGERRADQGIRAAYPGLLTEN